MFWIWTFISRVPIYCIFRPKYCYEDCTSSSRVNHKFVHVWLTLHCASRKTISSVLCNSWYHIALYICQKWCLASLLPVFWQFRSVVQVQQFPCFHVSISENFLTFNMINDTCMHSSVQWMTFLRSKWPYVMFFKTQSMSMKNTHDVT